MPNSSAVQPATPTARTVSAGVAGTAGARRRGPAEPPAHARQYAVRMNDGTLLATDVYLPPAGRGPVLLSRLPYDKAGSECFLPACADWFTERGYVVAVQDVRGKLRSAGELAPFAHEVSDGFDTIEWVTGQDFCAGPVGMFGDSYYGFTQWAAAASGHRALAAMAPRVTSASFTGLLNRQGVFSLDMAASWALETWVDEDLYEYEGRLDWTVRPQSEIVSHVLGGRRPVGLDRWAVGDLPNAASLPVTGKVPALHLGGFDDIVLRGQLDTWRRARSGPAPQHLVLDARDHGWTPRRALGSPYRDPQESAAGMQRFLDDYLGPLLPFFDHHLRDEPTDPGPAVRWRTGTGAWMSSETWPPSGTRSILKYLTGSGGLSDHAPRSRAEVGWQHDPAHPVPSNVHPYYPNIDPADDRAILDRTDVVSFAEAPATGHTVLLGPAQLELTVSSEAASAFVVATVYDQGPEGALRRITDGAAAPRW